MKHETPAGAGASLLDTGVDACGDLDDSTAAWRYDGLAGSEHPVPEGYCDRPIKLRNLVDQAVMVLACGTAVAAVCGPCSRRYRRRVTRLAFSGSIKPGRLVVLTLTAPGARTHTYPGGRKVCPCTKRATELGEWNGTLTTRTNHFEWDLKRLCGLTFQKFKAVEVQQRGALHVHIILRVTDGTLPKITKLRDLAIRHGFGHELVLDDKGECPPEVAQAVAWYLAKYVGKSAGERQAVPYLHPRTGERHGRPKQSWHPIVRHDGSRAWVDPETGEVVNVATKTARWRTWSCSREWGPTMKEVKLSEYQWRLARRAEQLSESEARRLAGEELPPKAALDPDYPRYASQPALPLSAGNLEPM